MLCSQQLPLAMADQSQQLLLHRLCLLLAAIAVRGSAQTAAQLVQSALGMFQNGMPGHVPGQVRLQYLCAQHKPEASHCRHLHTALMLDPRCAGQQSMTTDSPLPLSRSPRQWLWR